MSTLGTVLVVDDDDSIVWVLGRLLRHLGYDVATALRGQDALPEVERLDEQLICVLMDIVMPGANGLAVASQVSEYRPDLPIILMGGSLTQKQQREVAEQFGGFIPKPFSISELSTVLETVLSAWKLRGQLAKEVSV